ncbi:hypothetical protein WMY93_010213 [Mugilogobius chulae]|uniref:Uncharacterized protein n=1 Tax=Mugilogobius chulae TaxID=88201 RepID=A0AAW0PAG4_9GOBI
MQTANCLILLFIFVLQRKGALCDQNTFCKGVTLSCTKRTKSASNLTFDCQINSENITYFCNSDENCNYSTSCKAKNITPATEEHKINSVTVEIQYTDNPSQDHILKLNTDCGCEVTFNIAAANHNGDATQQVSDPSVQPPLTPNTIIGLCMGGSLLGLVLFALVIFWIIKRRRGPQKDLSPTLDPLVPLPLDI